MYNNHYTYTLLKPFLGATLPTHHLQGLQATGAAPSKLFI